MSEIEAFTPDNSGSMLTAVFWDSEGGWVPYKDHQAEMERLTSKRDAAQAEVKRLIADRAAAEAAIERLKDDIEDANNWLQADARAIGRTNAELEQAKADVERLTAERDAAQAEVERLQGDVERLRKEANGLTAPMVGRVMAERDLATAEVERLRKEVERLTEESEQRRVANHRIMTERGAALNEVERLRAEVKRLQANGQAILDTSRPTDEDIWREAFMSQLHDRYWAASEVADLALADYRKRWPR